MNTSMRMISSGCKWLNIGIVLNFYEHLPTPKDSLLYTLVEEGAEMREA